MPTWAIAQHSSPLTPNLATLCKLHLTPNTVSTVASRLGARADIVSHLRNHFILFPCRSSLILWTCDLFCLRGSLFNSIETTRSSCVGTALIGMQIMGMFHNPFLQRKFTPILRERLAFTGSYTSTPIGLGFADVLET